MDTEQPLKYYNIVFLYQISSKKQKKKEKKKRKRRRKKQETKNKLTSLDFLNNNNIDTMLSGKVA